MAETTCVTLGLAPSFGFGDRIGLATPGHVEAMQRSGNGIEPIYPQQSKLRFVHRKPSGTPTNSPIRLLFAKSFIKNLPGRPYWYPSECLLKAKMMTPNTLMAG